MLDPEAQSLFPSLHHSRTKDMAMPVILRSHSHTNSNYTPPPYPSLSIHRYVVQPPWPRNAERRPAIKPRATLSHRQLVVRVLHSQHSLREDEPRSRPQLFSSRGPTQVRRRSSGSG